MLPGWERLRSMPQWDPIHMFTVDRHLMETAVQASRLVRRVRRPDLLLLAAIFHDIGKGTGRDHSVAGAEMIREWLERLGVADADIAHHRDADPPPPAAGRHRVPPRSRRPRHHRRDQRRHHRPRHAAAAVRAHRGRQPGRRAEVLVGLEGRAGRPAGRPHRGGDRGRCTAGDGPRGRPPGRPSCSARPPTAPSRSGSTPASAASPSPSPRPTGPACWPRRPAR